MAMAMAMTMVISKAGLEFVFSTPFFPIGSRGSRSGLRRGGQSAEVEESKVSEGWRGVGKSKSLKGDALNAT